jgi:predicted AlkP superfamily phosphohydrolase/phosphomutase
MTRSDNGQQRVKTLLIGLDGATMSLFGPLMARGLLPNLKRLAEGGTQATLMSTIPPFTGPAWVSICTGVHPGRHGIYGFGAVDAETGEMLLVRSGQIGSPRLWQLLNAQGLTTGVVNVPLIYPPDRVDGFMLTGMLTPPNTDNFAYPRSAGAVVNQALGQPYQIDVPIYPEYKGDTRVVPQLFQLLRQREQAVYALLDQTVPDFLMVVLVIPDRLQHLYWGYLVPSGPDDPVFHSPPAEAFRAAIEPVYREIDAVVGRLLQRVGPDCRTFVVSDHGFGRFARVVHINNWLRDQGWLQLRSGGGALQRFKRALRRTPGLNLLAGAVPRRVVLSVRREMFDWSRTQAYAGSKFQQGIYLNLKGRQPHGSVEPGAYETLRRQIAAELAQLPDPRSGELLFERVYLREEIFEGPYVDLAPDILPVVRGHDGMLSPGFADGNLVHYQDGQPDGCHYPEGILLASGPGLRRQARLDAASVVDITPTVLYSLGKAVPAGLEGEVLSGLFEPEELLAHPPQMDERSAVELAAFDSTSAVFEVDPDEDNESVVEHLRGLGYL